MSLRSQKKLQMCAKPSYYGYELWKLPYYCIAPLWKLFLLRLYLTPFNTIFKGKRVTVTLDVTQHCVGDKRQIQRFLHEGSSPPIETAAHSGIFLHSESEWPLRAPGWTHMTCQGVFVAEEWVPWYFELAYLIFDQLVKMILLRVVTPWRDASLHVTYHNTSVHEILSCFQNHLVKWAQVSWLSHKGSFHNSNNSTNTMLVKVKKKVVQIHK